MRKLLISIDGRSAARTRSTVAEAITLYQQEPVAIHLLSVQPAVSGHVAMLFTGSELHDIQHAAGAEDLEPAQALLDIAGIPWQASVMVGRSAETIARSARELGCDRILMGRESGENFVGKLLGSVAAQVRQLVGGTGDCQVLGS